MFVPEDNGKTFSLRVPKFIIYSLITFIVIFCFGLGVLIFKAGEIAAKLQLVYSLRVENKKINEENAQLRLISQKVAHLEELANYLENLAVPAQIKNYKVDRSVEDSLKNLLEKKTQNVDNILKSSSAINNQDTVIQDVAAIPNIPPVEGWITRGLSESNSSNLSHTGLDYAASAGSPIKATAPGIVEDVKKDVNFGLVVTIKHGNGFVTRYGHCSQILVSVRDRVKRGQTIALVGNTGRSSAPHLHYELLKDEKIVDPRSYFISHQEY